MDPVLWGAIVFTMLILCLSVGVWVFSAVLVVGMFSMAVILGFPLERVGIVSKAVLWRSATAWELSAIPMFILMGEIIFHTDISDRLFRGLAPLVERIPGRLLHTNVLGCTLFAAVSGSSPATTATVGKITTTALEERNYDSRLSIGSLAGAGTLGLMIPPSIMMIIYGILAEVSITKLFIAGVVPGLLIAGLYGGYIGGRCLLNPRLAPSGAAGASQVSVLRGLCDLGPILVLVVIVLGGIYTGVATPTEAAAVGVLATVVLAVCLGQWRVAMFLDALMASVRTACMICLVLVCASVLSSAIGYMHLPADLARTISSMDLSAYELILILSVFYVVLGLFLDGISVTVMTLPITLPLVAHAGFDPLWFGVFIVVMVELGLITPPIGFNLFVLQAMTRKPISEVARAALPFFMLLLIAVVVLTVFPELVTWLPRSG